MIPYSLKTIKEQKEKQLKIEEDMLKMMDKIDQLEQSIINVDTKYKMKLKKLYETVI